MTEHKDIHQAINEVMKEVGYVQKQKSDTLKYTYAGEAGLIEALRPSMVAHGIYMHVKEIKKVYREQYQTKSGTQMSNTMIHGVVRFAHVSGTFVDVEAMGEGADSGDKSANKAMTGMYKYALRQTFCIETGDDPDRFPSELYERGQNIVQNSAQPVQEVQEDKKTEELKPKSNGMLSVSDLRLAENVMKIKEATDKQIPEIMKVINLLDKTKDYSIEYVISQVNS